MTNQPENSLPLGKLPPHLLAKLLAGFPQTDPRVILGPGLGLDCAIIDLDTHYLVIKTDPITFVAESIGWYAVQVNANDIATTGAVPRWFVATLLLPEGATTEELVMRIGEDMQAACDAIGVTIVGGHTEITSSLDRPILVGTMIGEVNREQLVTPRGCQPGDRLLLAGTVPLEGTAILAQTFSEELSTILTPAAVKEAQEYLNQPGISVLPAARSACEIGQVTGMHDPTEGGLAGALWEFAEACGHQLIFSPQAVPITPLSRQICAHFGLDPLATIASGALLISASAEGREAISQTLAREEISCVEIGHIASGPPEVRIKGPLGSMVFPRPERDELARLFEEVE
jgi:hydrogenase maturation factor